jgi:hypothetical protein
MTNYNFFHALTLFNYRYQQKKIFLYSIHIQSRNTDFLHLLKLRSSFASPSLILRTKVGAKSVQSRCKVGEALILNGRFIEFGTEEERKINGLV